MGALKPTAPQGLLIGLAMVVAAGDMSWHELQPSGTPPRQRNDHSAVFDSTAGTMLVFGGYDDTSDWPYLLGDLHRYDVQANAWGALSPSAPPPARHDHTAVFDSVSRAMLIFGGRGDSRIQLSDVHRYDVQANAWSALSSAPFARSSHTAVFDTTTRTMVIFGGLSGSSPRNHLHSFDVQANAWSALSPAGSWPPPRGSHTAVLDTALRTILVFGGYGTTWLNDLHSYDLQVNAWTALSPSGSAPSPRAGHTAVWDSASRVMLVFGGYSRSSDSVNDLHIYDVEANAWSALLPSGAIPSARSAHTAVLDSMSRILIFGGRELNDLHALESGDATTTTITVTMTAKFCDPGSEPSGEERCEACAPGRFGAGGPQTCVACASGHASKAGSSVCQPTLAHVVANLAKPARTTSDVSSGVVRLHVALTALPQDIFNVQALSYRVDVAATVAALSAQSPCTAKWEVSENAAHVQLNYTDLSYPCSTNVSDTDSGIRRDGVLGIYLVAEGSGGGTEVASRWTQDVALVFRTHTLTLGAQTFDVGAYTSTLELFTSVDFTTVRLPFLRSDDIAHVEHAVDEDDTSLRMKLVMVWLSRSSNVSDLDAVEHNLTSVLVQHDGGRAGSLRYSFSTKPCKSCYLQSLAQVFHDVNGRWLEPLGSFTVRSLYLEVLEVSANALPEELPDIIITVGPATALAVSAVVAAVTGIIVGLLGRSVQRPEFGAMRIQVFLVLGACDCLTDIMTLVLAYSQGDLQFSNDGGAVLIALSTCVGLSVALFFVEVCFWACFRQRFQAQQKTIHFVLACVHLAVEDSFQAGVYGCIVASQAHAGLQFSASVLVGFFQAVVFAMAKTAEIAGFFEHCCYSDSTAERPAAVEVSAGSDVTSATETPVGSKVSAGGTLSL